MVSEWFHWFQGGFHWFLVGFPWFWLDLPWFLVGFTSVSGWFPLVSGWFLVKLTHVRNFAECTYGPAASARAVASPVAEISGKRLADP